MTPSSPFFSADAFPGLRRRIVSWFARHGRDLPWRNQTDPYLVWVSEIMLQQTTTETVKGYFGRFIDRFPTISALASAEVSEVLKYWEGLGYYRRAHQLHRAAEVMADRCNGKFPTSGEEIERLPGIGRYTAGAVLSFAFNQRRPILEANTTRLHARILALSGDVTTKSVSEILWDFAERILPNKNPGPFNQALIDLGRTVCLPRGPRCGDCPCLRNCRAAQTGRQSEIPSPKAKAPKEPRTEVACLVRRSFFTHREEDHSRFLFVRYPENVRWGGLWDFPRFLLEGDGNVTNDPKLTLRLREFLDSNEIRLGAVLREIRHAVTRYQIRLVLCDTLGESAAVDPAPLEKFLTGKMMTVNTETRKTAARRMETRKKVGRARTVPFAGGDVAIETLAFRWLTLAEASEIPLSSTGRRLVTGLQKTFGK